MMGNFTLGRMVLIIVLLSLPLQIASAAANDTSPALFIGDPIEAWNKLPSATQDRVKLILGILFLIVILVGLASLLISHTKASAGSAIGNAAMRNEGAHNMVMIVALAIVLLLSIGVFWFFMTGGV